MEEAEELFRRSSFYYQEGLMWMGPVAFRYYVHALIRYIHSHESTDDSDIINCFAGLFEFRLECEPAELVPVAGELVSLCEYVLRHQDRFDLHPEIHGDVPARLEWLGLQLVRLANPTPAP